MDDVMVLVPLNEVTDPVALLRHLVREQHSTKEAIMGALEDVKQVAADFARQIEQEIAKIRAILADTIAGLTEENEDLRAQLEALSTELDAVSEFAQAKSDELQKDDPVVEPEPDPDVVVEPEAPVGDLDPDVPVIEPVPDVQEPVAEM